MVQTDKNPTLRTFGITIGVTVLQNTLKKHLPSELLNTFPKGAEISYAIIPQIPSLPEPLRSEVRSAFAVSIRNIWYVAIGLSGLGLLIALPAKALTLSVVTDEEWGFTNAQEKARRPNLEGEEDLTRDTAGKSESDKQQDELVPSADTEAHARLAKSHSAATANS